MDNAIFITGAGQRIGLYLAQQFIHAQYPVCFTYRTHHPAVDDLIAQGALAIQVDFLQANALDVIAEQLQGVTSLRALIHNASLWLPDAQLADAGLEALFKLHIALPFHLSELCAPLLMRTQSEQADIIALSDANSLKGHPDYAAYLATKAGLDSLVQSWAKKWAPTIKVNQISPGLIMFNQDDSDAYKAARLAQAAIPIEPGPEVIWQAVQYLMSSPYSTGARIELGQLTRS